MINKSPTPIKFYILVVMMLLCMIGYSQQNTSQVKGLIKGPDNAPVAFATVILLRQDSVFIKGEVSKEDGSFEIVGIKPDTYRVKVQNLEYETHQTDNFNLSPNETKTLPAIKLEKSVTQLDEVVVEGKKALVEVHADKMVFNVASSVNASGFNGLELLGKAPGVMIDLDNNILLKGKSGVRIFINGRPSRLSGTDLAVMLQSMQSDNIESIEIITNPSSKYEAEGNAGIINIRLKKNSDAGFNGTIVSSYSKGDLPRNNNGLTLNYNKKKVNTYGDIARFGNKFQDDFIDTKEQSGFLMDQYSYGINKNKGINYSAGIDYTINSKHSISLVGRGVKNDGLNNSNAVTSIIGNQPTTILDSESNADISSKNLNYNLNYQYNASPTSTLSANISHGTYSSESLTEQPNAYYESNGTLIKEVNNSFDAKNNINLWSAQADFEKRFKAVTFSTGGKYSYINTDNQFSFYNIENGIPILDINRSNNFTYLEKVSSLYMILGTSLSEKIKLNAGLRMENTSSAGRLRSEIPTKDSDVERNYTNLFPNVSLSYSNKKNSEFNVSVGRRITRPTYSDLNPFETKLSQLMIFKGNPFLKPTYVTNYEVTYSFKNKLVISNTYSVTTGFFAQILHIIDTTGTVLIPQNMQRSTNNGLSISYPVTVSKWWEFTSFVNYNYTTYNGEFENTVIDLNASIYNFRIQNNFNLPGKFKLEITYSYNSPWIWRGSIKIESTTALNLGVRKDFFDGRLQLRMTATDLFNTTSDYPYHGNYGGLDINGIRSFDTKRFGAGLTFKFGNQKLKSSRRKKSGLEDELNRIN